MNPKEATHIRPYTEELMRLCTSKVEEFHLLGYDQVNVNDVWEFVCNKIPSDTPLHRVVDVILSIRIMDFMNYQTITTLKQAASEAPLMGKR